MRYSVSIFAMVAMAGCHSEQSVLVVPAQRAEPSIRREVLSTDAIRTDPAAGMRHTETIKVYGVNRYVDAGDPRVVHERHAIYRLEQQPTWVTRVAKKSQ